METKRTIRTLLVALPLLLAACGQSSQATREDRPLLAMATPPTDSPGTYHAAMAPAPEGYRFPDVVLHDPAERFALMQRLRVQLVAVTRQVPESRWSSEVRPLLRRRLADAGLRSSDVDFLLWEIEAGRRS